MRNNSGTTVGAFTGQTLQAIQTALNGLGAGVFTTGNIYVLDPLNGSDFSGDGSFDKPVQTLAAAYALCVTGNNDVVLLVGNGLTTATARLSAGFTWAKNATHLIGMAAPVMVSQRARIAPTTAVIAFTPFFTVSGNGCVFQNIQWFMGFALGIANQIGMVVSGGRNFFKNCSIQGIVDDDSVSGDSAGSRSLKITSTGENVFEDCTIGADTRARSTSNATLEFAAGTARNVFRRCIFPFFTDNAGVLGIVATGNASMDRWQTFEDCQFINAVKSTSTTMTVLASCTTASPGGMLLFNTPTVLVGITDYGDANALSNSFIRQSGASAATEGIAIAPS